MQNLLPELFLKSQAATPQLCGFHADLGKFLFGRQTFSSIHRNGFVDHGAAVNALPGIEDEKKIREPL
jgi:hypothetical protein